MCCGIWLLVVVNGKKKDDPLDEWEAFKIKAEKERKTQIPHVKNSSKPPEPPKRKWH